MEKQPKPKPIKTKFYKQKNKLNFDIKEHEKKMDKEKLEQEYNTLKKQLEEEYKQFVSVNFISDNIRHFIF